MSEGVEGCSEAIEPEELFFVTFVLHFLIVIVLQKGKGGMG